MKTKQELMDMVSLSQATLEVLVDIRDILAKKTEIKEKEEMKKEVILAEEDILKIEQDRILKEGYKLIEWNKEPKNQWAGILHANTTINAIQQILNKVREQLSGHN